MGIIYADGRTDLGDLTGEQQAQEILAAEFAVRPPAKLPKGS
jgi:hypothetical protein